jgi:hypothetical protein
MVVASSNVAIGITEGVRDSRTGDKGHECSLAFTRVYEGQTIPLAAQRTFESSHPSSRSGTNIFPHLPTGEIMRIKGVFALFPIEIDEPLTSLGGFFMTMELDIGLLRHIFVG